MITVRESGTDEILELRAMVAELHEHIRPLDPDVAPTEEILDQYMAHLVDTQVATRGAVFVAEEDAQLLGYAWVFGLVEPDKDEREDRYTVVSDLYVREAARGRGIAQRLMKKSEMYAQALGASKLELKVLAANLPAREFYKRIGYEERVVVLVKRFPEEGDT